MNMVFIYYENPLMLARQIECWNSYVGELNPLPEVLLVDDGSPKAHAVDIVLQNRCQLPIKVFRIKEDIPWNMPGARNLGCLNAEEWIYMSDIDTLLPAPEAKKFFSVQPLDNNNFYMPKRVWQPDFVPAARAQVNLLFHKSKYLETGGYDEDYSGAYGKEDTDFYCRLRNLAVENLRSEVVVQAVPPEIIEDARTIGLSRDKLTNARLFEHKLARGFPRPTSLLRFSWERVI